MRIGFDAGPITTTRSGVGNYCYYLLKNLLALAPAESFRLFSTGRARIDLGPIAGKAEHRHWPVPTRLMYFAWERLGRPRVDLALGGVDVYHATNFFLPPTRRARRVVTIHDLAFLAVPEYCSPKIVGPFARGVSKFCREADAIMVYSESTRSDVSRYLGVDPGKMTVAPMAVDEDFRPMDRAKAASHVAEKYGVKGPFLLFVSTLEPRKNLVGLLRSFARVEKSIPHNLVLIGSVGWNTRPIFELIETLGIQDRVVRPGFVPHLELPAFYCAADAFVFPTHYEGFGLPLLEALTCGCPVVTSTNSSVREVTGGAALHVDSLDEAGFADAVMRILDDRALRARLVALGLEHARKFSWHACAESTMGVYRRLAE